MSLQTLTQTLVKDAFDIIGDLSESVTYKQHTSQSYDPDTGNVVETTTDVTGVKAVFARFSEEEMDDEINVLTDVKCLIAAENLPSVTPDKDDEIVRADSSEWNVIRVRGVPGDSLWILMLRKRQ